MSKATRGDQLHCYIFCVLQLVALCIALNSLSIVGPGEIPLKHYGKRELLGKTANMEAEYDIPMEFDPGLLPELSQAVGPDIQHRLWDYGVEVAGNPKKYQKKQTPTLEAGIYGLTGGEELLAVEGYLYAHGAYQLAAVRNLEYSWVSGDQFTPGHVALFLVIMGSCVV